MRAAVLLALLALAGCGDNYTNTGTVLVEPVTGCEYTITDQGHARKRIDGEGKHVCNKVSK